MESASADLGCETCGQRGRTVGGFVADYFIYDCKRLHFVDADRQRLSGRGQSGSFICRHLTWKATRRCAVRCNRIDNTEPVTFCRSRLGWRWDHAHSANHGNPFPPFAKTMSCQPSVTVYFATFHVDDFSAPRQSRRIEVIITRQFSN